MIRAILVDDENKALKSLTRMVETHLPFIEIIYATQSPEEAIEKITELKPDLIFLDIDMPKLSGFDVLMQIDSPDFEIIFVTAHNNYAIDAIKHSAIGYVVKPIDSDELIIAGNNAKKNIEQKTAFEKNIDLLQFVNQSNSTIIIPTQKGVSFFKPEEIIRLEGVDGYTNVYLKNKKTIMSSYNIGKIKEKLKDKVFYQVHKSHIININYLKKYDNEGLIELLNGDFVPLSKTRKKDFFEFL